MLAASLLLALAPGRGRAAAPSEPLDAMKKLAGQWQGKAMMGGKEVPVTMMFNAQADPLSGDPIVPPPTKPEYRSIDAPWEEDGP